MTGSHEAQLKHQLPWPHNAAYCPQLATDQYQIVQLNFKADKVTMTSKYHVTIVNLWTGR